MPTELATVLRWMSRARREKSSRVSRDDEHRIETSLSIYNFRIAIGSPSQKWWGKATSLRESDKYRCELIVRNNTRTMRGLHRPQLLLIQPPRFKDLTNYFNNQHKQRKIKSGFLAIEV